MAKFLDKLKSHSALGYFQVFCYYISVFLSLLVVVPVGITLRNFHGKCVLFAEIVWDNTVIYPWAEEACDYVLYMTLAVGFVYAGLMGTFTLLAVVPKTNKKPHRFGLIQAHNVTYILNSLNPVFLLIDTCIVLLMLASALVITTGLARFCKDLVKTMDDLNQPIGTCLESRSVDWNQFRVEGGMDHGLYGAGFYGAYTIASISAWCLVVIWTLLLLGDFSVCCRGCSCKKATEKQRLDKSFMIAAHRSRFTTPIATPRSYGQIPLAQQQAQQQYQQQQQAQRHHHQQPPMGAHGYPPSHLPPKY